MVDLPFKSYMTLGTIAKTLVQQYRRTFEVNFGCEMEFKNDCDRYFGKMKLQQCYCWPLADYVF